MTAKESKAVARYHVDYAIGHAEGGWVKFTEHQSALQAAEAELGELRRRASIYYQERAHLISVKDHLIKVLSSIHMRCAPPDVVTEDGKTMRFVPPDPEFYWRELSAKVKAIEADIQFRPANYELLASDGGADGDSHG